MILSVCQLVFLVKQGARTPVQAAHIRREKERKTQACACVSWWCCVVHVSTELEAFVPCKPVGLTSCPLVQFPAFTPCFLPMCANLQAILFCSTLGHLSYLFVVLAA